MQPDRPPRTTTHDPADIRRILEDHVHQSPYRASLATGLEESTIRAWRRKREQSGGMWPDDDYIADWHRRQALRAKWRQQRTRRLIHGPQTIDPTGTQRRIQALYALGWTWNELGARMGGTKDMVRRLALGLNCTDRGVKRDTAARVARLYGELCMVRPEGWVADRARGYALRAGWVPPLAWDDIDNDPEPADVGRPCTHPECAGRVVALGLCRTHYNAQLREKAA